MVENKKYLEDSTADEIASIESLVHISDKDDRIMIYDELQHVTPFSVKLCFDKLEKLVEGKPKFGIMVNVEQTEHPDAAARRAIADRMAKLDTLVHCSIIVDRNLLMRLALSFILRGFTKDIEYSVVSSKEGAFQKIKDALD